MSIQAARRMSALIAGFALVAAACGGGSGDTSGDVTLRSAGAIAVDADDVVTTTTTEAVAAAGGAGDVHAHARAVRAPPRPRVCRAVYPCRCTCGPGVD